MMRIKQVITIPVYPHTFLWTTWLYYLHAVRLYRKEHFDLVITEHFGLQTTFPGYLLKKKFPHVKWMPIFWDPLSGIIAPKYLPCKFSYRRRQKTEQKIFQQADCSIVMQAHYPLLQHLYKNVPLLNKIRPLDLPSFGAFVKDKDPYAGFSFNKEKIYLCFAGTVGSRNLEQLADMLDKTNLPDIELLIVCAGEVQPRVQALAQKVPFSVRFLSYMPHRKLMQFFYQIDMFVHLGINSNTMVASKIFEYMSFGKPIIATYKQDDDANLPYLKKYPLSFLLDERKAQDPAQINNLRSFIEQNARKSVPYEKVAPAFYANTPQAYVDEINKLMEN